MRWSGFWWLAIVAAVLMLENNWVRAAPSPQTDEMLKTLLQLDRMYSSIARPRFGKRADSNSNFAAIDYEGQFQSGEPSDWLPARR